jgi:ketosteroid isomerase-like protein
MSQENVEIVRAFYAAYNRGDLDAVLNDLAPDSVPPLRRGVPVPRPYLVCGAPTATGSR